MRPESVRGIVLTLLVAASLLGAAAHAQQAAPATQESGPAVAGTIALAEGEASVGAADGSTRPARPGDTVRVGETLVVGRTGEIHVNMQDSGFIAVRPGTRLKVEDYKADGAADDRSVLRLLAGGFRSVSGWIAKFNARAYKVVTPTATIGIRGTDHEPHVVEEGSADGEAGTYDRVFAGATSIESDGASADVAPEQAGFAPVQGRGRPRVLAQIPSFFRPGPHEAEIAQKHQEIQRVIDQRRAERQRVLEERRAQLRAAQERLREQRAAEPASRGWNTRADRNQDRADARERTSIGRRLTVVNRRLTEIRFEREAIEADVSPESRRANFERLRALNQENQALAAERAQLETRRRELEARQEARDHEQAARAAESEEARKAREDMQGSRRDMREERDSANEEIRALRREERRRYLDEVQRDRRQGRTAKPPAPETAPPAEPKKE